ncbi:MAG: V-type ATP synthase subunit D [Candidatus Doudnabacteria bacterium]|nr:V-type ATP synthase subunit D [Candidatus Doudnabacteria bacterium]MCA9387834.1 V-type ATP synthase subunit D [Candidatus Andersenbacteria bacterium]
MAGTTINPTRMELLRLRRRVKTAKRGHKLLKEKRDGLMKAFMQIVRDARKLRVEVEQDLGDAFKKALLVSAAMDGTSFEEAVMVPSQRVTLEAETKNVMSVRVPKFQSSVEGTPYAYGLLGTSGELDQVLEVFGDVMEKMLKLAEIEHSAKLMAVEIEKTRRRVNALEHVLIPEQESAVKMITMKLAEQERATIATLMRVKEIVAG